MPKHALIVEDDLCHIERAQCELEAAGLDVTSVRSCMDAMASLRRVSYDLVLLDLFVLDGPTTQLSNYIRMRYPSLPIVSVTGSRLFADGQHGDVLSADYVLRKPLREEELGAIALYLTDQLNESASAVR